MTDRKTWLLGSSTATANELTPTTFAEFAKYDIRYLEISHNLQYLNDIDFTNNYKTISKQASDAGVHLHSFHVPFGSDFTISTSNKEHHAFTMETTSRLIDCVGDIGVKTVVIHPSFEPISDDERQEQLKTSVESAAILSEKCKKYGMKLCIEDLPRTCLVNCSFEALIYLNSIPDISLCFDTNHLLIQQNEDFLDDLIDNGMNGRIATLHVSDYDFVNERHLLPTGGINDWKSILTKLEMLDYDGIFMYEVRSDGYKGAGVAQPSLTPEGMIVASLGDLKLNYDMLMSL